MKSLLDKCTTEFFKMIQDFVVMYRLFSDDECYKNLIDIDQYFFRDVYMKYIQSISSSIYNLIDNSSYNDANLWSIYRQLPHLQNNVVIDIFNNKYYRKTNVLFKKIRKSDVYKDLINIRHRFNHLKVKDIIVGSIPVMRLRKIIMSIEKILSYLYKLGLPKLSSKKSGCIVQKIKMLGYEHDRQDTTDFFRVGIGLRKFVLSVFPSEVS